MTTPNITINPADTVTTFLASLPTIPRILDGSTSIPFPSSVATYYAQQMSLGPVAVFHFSGLPLSQATVTINNRAIASGFLLGLNGNVLEDTDRFFKQYSFPPIPSPVNPSQSFTNFSDLMSSYETYISSIVSPFLGSYGTGYDQALYQGLLQDFATAMGIQLDSNNQVIGGDWAVVQPPLDLSSSNPSNPFILAMDKFLSSFTYPNETPPPSGASNEPFYEYFINKYHAFLSGISTIQDPSLAYVDPTASANPFLNLASYRQIYNAFASDTSDAAFQSFFNLFYQQEIAQKGYFMPSQMLEDWFSTIRNTFGANLFIDDIGSSLAGNDSEKAQVLNRIILLLISLIQTLQNIGIAQANRLQYLTQFQNAYTALETQVPVFLQSTAGPIGGPGSNAVSIRNELNSSFNGIILDNLRSLRSVQEDNAKQVQSQVNRTNDAVNQQTDMVTTFLQQMTTLLGTILK